MATTLYLTNSSFTTGQPGCIGTGGTVGKTIYTLKTSRGSGVVGSTIGTALAATEPQFTAASRPAVWVTEPIDAAFTLSGTTTWNIWGIESNMSANAGWRVYVRRIDSQGALIAPVVDNYNNLVEIGLTDTATNFTHTPTSTSFVKGDRLMISVHLGDASQSMAAGYTVTMNYNGTTAAASGDTYVTFTENFGFVTAAPAGSVIYLTDTDSGLTNRPDYHQRITQIGVRGGGVASCLNYTLTSYGIDDSGSAYEFTENTNADVTGWLYPTAATSLNDTAGPAWSNPSSITTNDGSYATATSSGGWLFDTLQGTGFDYSSVYGRYSTIFQMYGYQTPTNTVDHMLQIALLFQGGATDSFMNPIMPLNTPALLGPADPGVGTGVGTRLGKYARDNGPLYCQVDDAYANESGITYWLDYVRAKVYASLMYEWYSPQLNAFTLSGLVRAHLRMNSSSASNVNEVPSMEIAVVNSDGTSPTVFGRGFGLTSITTTEAAQDFDIAGSDIAVTSNQRLRFRVITGGYQSQPSRVYNQYYSFFFNGTSAGASGDSYITLPQTVSEPSNPIPLNMDAFDRRTPRRRTIQRM